MKRHHPSYSVGEERKPVDAMLYPYNPERGISYARQYALYAHLPEYSRLFFYDKNGNDCTNFCSQCVWAAYGGWIPGTDDKTIAENKERIKKSVCMVPYTWYGSLFFSGSNKWCRVVELGEYALIPKALGPRAIKVYEGDWKGFRSSYIKEGDVVQLVVSSYAAYRYGHCLYVTQAGKNPDNILICCHSYDRKDTPFSEFTSNQILYPKLRILRFHDASFAN